MCARLASTRNLLFIEGIRCCKEQRTKLISEVKPGDNLNSPGNSKLIDSDNT